MIKRTIAAVLTGTALAAGGLVVLPDAATSGSGQAVLHNPQVTTTQSIGWRWKAEPVGRIWAAAGSRWASFFEGEGAEVAYEAGNTWSRVQAGSAWK